jgi:hypothetical protein
MSPATRLFYYESGLFTITIRDNSMLLVYACNQLHFYGKYSIITNDLIAINVRSFPCRDIFGSVFSLF